MISFIYYDSDGILREFITSPSRKTSNVNSVYIYYETQSPDSVSVSFTNKDGTTIAENITSGLTTAQIPYDEERTLKYFKYNTDYVFYVKTFTSNQLAVSGPMYLTPTYTFGESTYVLGTYAFIVEDNNIALDDTMTYGMYYYLLNQIDGGYNSAVATASTLAEGSSATASVQYVKNGVVKTLSFVFGIPTGATGATGAKGDTGERGSKWYIGAGNPPSAGSTYLVGDMFLNYSTYHIYQLIEVSGTTLSWEDEGTIKSPVISSASITEA